MHQFRALLAVVCAVAAGAAAQDGAIPTSVYDAAASIIQEVYMDENSGTPYPSQSADAFAPGIAALASAIYATPDVLPVIQSDLDILSTNPAAIASIASEFGVALGPAAGAATATGTAGASMTAGASGVQATTMQTNPANTASANAGGSTSSTKSTSTSKALAPVATGGLLLSGAAAAVGLFAVGLF